MLDENIDSIGKRKPLLRIDGFYIYEYFLNKFAKNIASDDGVFFTPKSLVKMIVNILEPKSGVLLENCTTSLIRVAAA